jgi:UDP-GlcNAc:undecaprenyl-phosphate GlcNAc-1-phosphate transferase
VNGPVAEVAGFLVRMVAFVLVIEVLRRLALTRGLVSHPNPIVRAHKVPVAYLGGTGLGLTYVALLVFHWIATETPPATEPLARTLGVLAFVLLGTWDDLRPIRPLPKLCAEALIAGGYLLVTSQASPLGLSVQLLLLLTLINAYNLVDVLDGLLVVLAAVFVLGLLILPVSSLAGLVPELWLLLAGLVAAFLFNHPPARIYLGDAGSLTLGFLIGAWFLDGMVASSPRQALALTGLCAIPLLEILLLVPARLGRGSSPLTGSADHFALRLQDQLHWSRWRVLAAAAAAALYFGMAPLVALHLSSLATAVYAVSAVGAAGFLWWCCWRIPPRWIG